jgi:hypothetical protein
MALADVYIEMIPLEIQADRTGWTPELHRISDSNHASLVEIWAADETNHQTIVKWEAARRRHSGLVAAALKKRKKSVLKAMNRQMADLLAGAPK